MRFAEVQAAAASKPKHITVEPSFWPPTWDSRPRTNVVLGLRALSEADVGAADQQAQREAESLHESPGEPQTLAYNDALRRWCVARALCDPNDSSKPHPLFQMAEDQIAHCWTPQGVRYVFEELERLILESGPLHPVATDEDVAELAALLLTGDALVSLDELQQRRARRLLAFVLEELRGEDPEDDGDTD